MNRRFVGVAGRVLLVPAMTSWLCAGMPARCLAQVAPRVTAAARNAWDDTAKGAWPAGFQVVQIPSTADGALQPAYFLPAPQGGPKKPLVVSLHTWSGGYVQADPLARLAQQEGWAYIHPHFRGPNNTRDACLSPKALSDIDDAIQYALTHAGADAENIFVAGASGGGYATLGAYLKSKHQIRLFLSWVPICDLVAWYQESVSRKANYANDILKCTSGKEGLDEQEARRRSPLHMDGPVKPRERLEIFAGIDDGHKGSVPVSHALRFFNRLAAQYGHPESRVSEADIDRLLTRQVDQGTDRGTIGGRKVVFTRNIPQVSVTLFAGGHEMLAAHCFQRMKETASAPSAPAK